MLNMRREIVLLVLHLYSCVFGAQIMITINSTDSQLQSVQEKEENFVNLRPIIGILSQDLTLSAESLFNYSSYIAASYVKFIEAAGARVVPIMIHRDGEYYENIVSSVNGILFPGGGASIANASGYGRAGDKLYNLVLAANEAGKPIPLWSTCLGFEMMLYLEAGRVNPLTRCNARNKADPLHFKIDWKTSKLFKNARPELMLNIQKKNLTSNFHVWCILPETMKKMGMDSNFITLSTSFDFNGTEYVSTIEHKKYPIFGTQWHPEKATFEWNDRASLSSIPHNPEAIEISQHLAAVFVNEDVGTVFEDIGLLNRYSYCL